MKVVIIRDKSNCFNLPPRYWKLLIDKGFTAYKKCWNTTCPFGNHFMFDLMWWGSGNYHYGDYHSLPDYHLFRTDILLVEIVEKMIDDRYFELNPNWLPKLGVVEIPDNIKWKIADDVDGEEVHEIVEHGIWK